MIKYATVATICTMFLTQLINSIHKSQINEGMPLQVLRCSDQYLTKPVSKDELLSAIRDHVKAPAE